MTDTASINNSKTGNGHNNSKSDTVNDSNKNSNIVHDDQQHDATPEVTSNYQKRRKHKPADFPKRPLSAYNIFFKETRESMLQAHREKDKDATPDFKSMVKEIAVQWKQLPDEKKGRVATMAETDYKRYKEEVAAYQKESVIKRRHQRKEMEKVKKKEQQEHQQQQKRKQLQQQQQDQQEEGETMPSRKKAKVLMIPNRNFGLDSTSSSTAGASDVGAAAAAAGSPEDLELLFAKELHILETIRKLRLRQVQVVKSLMEQSSTARTSGGGSGACTASPNAMDHLDHQRRVLGLPPLEGSDYPSVPSTVESNTGALEEDIRRMRDRNHLAFRGNALGTTMAISTVGGRIGSGGLLAGRDPMTSLLQAPPPGAGRAAAAAHSLAFSPSPASLLLDPYSMAATSSGQHLHPGLTPSSTDFLQREEALLYRSRLHEMELLKHQHQQAYHNELQRHAWMDRVHAASSLQGVRGGMGINIGDGRSVPGSGGTTAGERGGGVMAGSCRYPS